MTQQISVGLSDSADTVAAFSAAAAQARAGLGGPPDLGIVFAGAPHLQRLERALAEVSELLAPAAMIGCGAAGVVGPRREIEGGAGAVVWTARLPGAEIETFRIDGEPGGAPASLRGLPDPAERPASSVLMLADPYGGIGETALARIDAERPGVPVLGGLASAAAADGGGAALILDGELVDAGAVGCLLDGVEVIPCVSQGATPIGPEMAITAAEGNVIAELASQIAMGRLGEVLAELDSEQRAQAASGLLIGIVIDENRPEHERGDFLVRPIVGADRESGAIAVGQAVRVGQTVRLHVRDAESADEDLREALALQVGALGGPGAAGALIFTCNGRGRGMFGTADHDAEAVEDFLGAPVGGFFCAGEIGPVGGHNFLHGFTATLAVFPTE